MKKIKSNGKKIAGVVLALLMSSIAYSETIIDEAAVEAEEREALFMSSPVIGAFADVADEERSAPATEPEVAAAVENLFSDETSSPAENSKVQQLFTLLEDKTGEAIAGRSFGTAVSSRIQEIEGLKQELWALVNGTDSEEYKNELRAQMEAEIASRVNRANRVAETSPDGTLNERGQKKLANDIEAIQKKYDDLSRTSAPDSETLRKAENLRRKIGEKLTSLDATSFTESSLQNSGVELSVGNFTVADGKEGWPYTVVYAIDGKEIYRTSGVLSYSDISGKQTPAVPSIHSSSYEDDRKKYDNFLDSVDVFNKAFEDGLDFIEATLTGTVKVGDAPSSYNITVSSVVLKNIVSGKTAASSYRTASAIYVSEPEIEVDFERPAPSRETVAAGRHEAAPVEREEPSVVEEKTVEEPRRIVSIERTPVAESERNETPEESPRRERKVRRQREAERNKAETKSASLLQDNRTTLGALLYCLPGTYNVYAKGDDFAFTVGYSLTAGISNHFFIGMNAEYAPVKFYANENLFSIASLEDYGLDRFVCTGVAGWNWNCGPSLRMSAFLEAGLLFDSFAAGSGMSFEFASASSNVALQTGFTGYVDNNLDSTFKFTIGGEILF